jgi:hypothetical protein
MMLQTATTAGTTRMIASTGTNGGVAEPIFEATRFQAHRPATIPSGSPTISATNENVVACQAMTLAKVQFPSGSGTQADLTAGVYGWTAGSTGSGTVVLSGKSGSLNLEMTPYPHTATPSPEHVQGRWQCP